jgi:hypothetical protein
MTRSNRALDHLQHGRWDRKALIVVSDGGDNASSRTLDTVLEHARRADAVIYAVTLFDPDNREANPRVLKTLARETGGRAFAPGPGKDVAESVAEIAREIRSGYLIGFAPVETSDGGYRSLRVAVNAGDDRPLMARTRRAIMRHPHEGQSGRRGPRVLLWAERLLLAAGVTLLIVCALLVGDSVIGQRNARRALEATLPVDSPVLVPAVEAAADAHTARFGRSHRLDDRCPVHSPRSIGRRGAARLGCDDAAPRSGTSRAHGVSRRDGKRGNRRSPRLLLLAAAEHQACR